VTPINIRIANDRDQESWDAYVASHPDAGPYHLYGWKTAVEKGYGHKGLYLMAEDTDSGFVSGVLPLILFRLPWGRKSLVSLPYCDYGGPTGEPYVQQALIREGQRLASDLGVSRMEIRCSREHSDLSAKEGISGQVFSHKVSMILSLPASSDALWSGFKAKLKSQIRRPEKEGLRGHMGGPELLEDFYHIFTINMRDLGSPVHALKWFKAVLYAYNDKAKVGIISLKNEEPVAAGIILFNGQKVCIPWASSLRKYNRSAPNMLLYWQFLSWAAENGYSKFDFGRSTPGEGTYLFKKQWGARPEQLYWYKLGLDGGKIDYSDSCSKGRGTAARVWRYLPSYIADLIGPRVRKYISL
jgi:FemAB-related protein (PEP-CTERM system-associated)